VASKQPLHRQIEHFKDLPKPIQEVLDTVGVHGMPQIMDHLLIPHDSIDRVLQRITRDPARISTDDNLLLEYSTPRANELDAAFDTNLAQLREALGG
jgi:hypothetical protein